MTNALPQYEQHPIAIKLMPGGMDDQEFEAFCEDIEQRGIIMPVTLYEGKVLDGWHRYRAGHKTGSRFQTIEYKGKDPAGYIAAVNVLRRKLGSLQRALVGARLHLDHGLTQREVCKKLGISNEVVNLVLKALDTKNSKLIKRIETDSDFTRGMLREELEDVGMLRAKEVKEVPLGPNSVFQVPAGFISDAAATNGIAPETEAEDPDDDDDLIGGPMPDTGKKNGHAERRAKDTAPQRLAEAFKALMADEKETFLRMIWPEAGKLAVQFGLMDAPVIEESTPLQALTAAVKKAKGGKSKKAEELLQ